MDLSLQNLLHVLAQLSHCSVKQLFNSTVRAEALTAYGMPFLWIYLNLFKCLTGMKGGDLKSPFCCGMELWTCFPVSVPTWMSCPSCPGASSCSNISATSSGSRTWCCFRNKPWWPRRVLSASVSLRNKPEPSMGHQNPHRLETATTHLRLNSHLLSLLKMLQVGNLEATCSANVGKLGRGDHHHHHYHHDHHACPALP